MGKDKPMTIMTEMQKVQASLNTIAYRAEVLEKNLKTLHLSLEIREAMEKELEDVKLKLSVYNEQMKNLQKENTKSFTVAVLLMISTFLIFGLYKMFIEKK